MPYPATPNRRLIRGFSVHPSVIAMIEEEAKRRAISRSRVVEEALARHFGLGTGYAAAEPAQRPTLAGQATA